MLERILIGWDGSGGAEDALALADVLSPSGRSLVLARVFPRRVQVPRERREDVFRRAAAVGAAGEAVARDSRVDGLVELATELRSDLVVVGSSHPGRAGRLVAGNVGIGLMRSCRCAVAIAPSAFRRRYAASPRVIGVGWDGSEGARAALAGAADVGLALRAELRLVGVVDTEHLAARARITRAPGAGETIRCRREQLAHELDEALAELPSSAVATATVVSGDPRTGAGCQIDGGVRPPDSRLSPPRRGGPRRARVGNGCLGAFGRLPADRLPRQGRETDWHGRAGGRRGAGARRVRRLRDQSA